MVMTIRPRGGSRGQKARRGARAHGFRSSSLEMSLRLDPAQFNHRRCRGRGTRRRTAPTLRESRQPRLAKPSCPAPASPASAARPQELVDRPLPCAWATRDRADDSHSSSLPAEGSAIPDWPVRPAMSGAEPSCAWPCSGVARVGPGEPRCPRAPASSERSREHVGGEVTCSAPGPAPESPPWNPPAARRTHIGKLLSRPRAPVREEPVRMRISSAGTAVTWRRRFIRQRGAERDAVAAGR